jgi:hypothetical protein
MCCRVAAVLQYYDILCPPVTEDYSICFEPIRRAPLDNPQYFFCDWLRLTLKNIHLLHLPIATDKVHQILMEKGS